MTKLTQQQEKNIRKAINKARKAGQCLYQEGGQPCCVIGQLAALEGTSVRTMERWEGKTLTLEGGPKTYDQVQPKALKSYPSELLFKIQRTFDSDGGLKNVKKARKACRAVLNAELKNNE